MMRIVLGLVLVGMLGCGATAGEPKAAKNAKAAEQAAPAKGDAKAPRVQEVDAAVLKAFAADCAAKAAEAAKAETMTVKGNDGWLFFGPELLHVSVGQFWGDAAAKASTANTPIARPAATPSPPRAAGSKATKILRSVARPTASVTSPTSTASSPPGSAWLWMSVNPLRLLQNPCRSPSAAANGRGLVRQNSRPLPVGTVFTHRHGFRP